MEQRNLLNKKRTGLGISNCLLPALFMSILLLSTSGLNAQTPLAAPYTIVIDAGHGGKDPGAVGKKSHEKNIALAIAKKVGYYIESLMPEVNVIYTRKTDVFLDLDVRASIANKADADLFMSVHVDGIGTSSAYGTSTYVMGATKNENNLALAMKENKVIELEEDFSEKYKDYDPNDLTNQISYAVMQGAYQKQSLEFAAKIQDQLRTRAQRRDRGVHAAPFMVLWQTTMPSVLIETGFITNPNEENFLNTDYGQDLVASAIYRAFREYKTDIDNRTAVAGKDQIGKSAEEPLRKVDSVVETATKETVIVGTTDQQAGSNNAAVKENSPAQVEFRVQLLASRNPLKTTDKNFKGHQNLLEIKEGEYYKYLSEPRTDFENAQALRNKLVRDFPGAFVVAFKAGKRISLEEAKAR